MELTLYNDKTADVQVVTIDALATLQDMAQAYFGTNKPEFYHHNKLIDTSKNFSDYSVKNGDLIKVVEKVTEYKTTNALDNYTDDMMAKSDIAYTLIHIRGALNDYQFKIMIDSGAATNVMSYQMAQFLNIDHLIDQSKQGVAMGVGRAKIHGRIYGCNIKIGENMFVPINFSVMEAQEHDPHLILFGLDFLYSYGCSIDLLNSIIKTKSENIKFLNQGEIDNLIIPINATRERIKQYYRDMINNLPFEKREKTTSLIRKIITNIVSNPNNVKYKQINKSSKVLQDTILSNNRCVDFMNNIGFEDNGDKSKLLFNQDMNLLSYAKEVLCA